MYLCTSWSAGRVLREFRVSTESLCTRFDRLDTGWRTVYVSGHPPPLHGGRCTWGRRRVGRRCLGGDGEGGLEREEETPLECTRKTEVSWEWSEMSVICVLTIKRHDYHGVFDGGR